MKKNEKGSITLFVLISCTFMLMIILIINISILNKNSNQEKQINDINKQYNQNEIDLNNEYENIINKYTS